MITMITKNEFHEYKTRISGYQYISWEIIRDQGIRFPLISLGLHAAQAPALRDIPCLPAGTDPLMC